MLIVALVAGLLAWGTKLSSQFSIVVTTVKVLVVLLVIIVGAFYVKAANFTPLIPPPETDQSGSGADQSLLSLLTGAHSATRLVRGAGRRVDRVLRVHRIRHRGHHGRGDQEPAARCPAGHPGDAGHRNRALRAVSVVLSGTVPYTLPKTTPEGHANLATAFAANGVHWASSIISVGALAGLTTVVMVLLLGGCRVLFAMARDGLLPRPLAKTCACGTPVRITVLVALLVAVDGRRRFRRTNWRKWSTSEPFSRSCWCRPECLVLRRTRPDLPRGFRAPLATVTPDRLGRCVYLADGQPHRRYLGAIRRSGWPSGSSSTWLTAAGIRCWPGATPSSKLVSNWVITPFETSGCSI